MTYSLSFPKKRFSINTNLNYSESQFGTAPITYMGAMIGGGKSFLKGKLSTSANIGYGVNQSPTGRSGNVNFSFNSALQATPKQSFNLSIVMLNNKAEQALNPNVGEFRGNIGYNYNF